MLIFFGKILQDCPLDSGAMFNPGLGSSGNIAPDSVEKHKGVQPVGKKEKKYNFNASRRWKSKRSKEFMGHKQKKKLKTTDNTNNANNHNEWGHKLVASYQTSKTEFKALKKRSAKQLKSSPLNTLPCIEKRSTGLLISKATGFKIQYQQLLADCITKAAICICCKNPDSKLVLYEKTWKRQELDEKLYPECSLWQVSTDLETSSIARSYLVSEVNIRSVYAAQEFGLAGLEQFCTTMNLPLPVSKRSFYSMGKTINKECTKRADTNMKCAANRLMDLTKERCPKNAEVTNKP